MAGSFIDTNILIYLGSGDAAKADRAEAIVRQGGAISVQVLNEVTNVARRKMHLSWTETHQFLSMIRTLLTVHALSGEVHEEGVSLAERHGFSIYDAMIVASALLAECDTLWTEDMQHGMMIGSRLRIVDPFRQA
jgi:predicted nucleic acid-binding protein